MACLDISNIEDLALAFRVNGERLRAHTFRKEVIELLLSPDNVESLLVFLGLNEEGIFKPVLVAQDIAGALLLPRMPQKLKNDDASDEEGHFADLSTPCPPECGSL